jgi:hypothetical protein
MNRKFSEKLAEAQKQSGRKVGFLAFGEQFFKFYDVNENFPFFVF